MGKENFIQEFAINDGDVLEENINTDENLNCFSDHCVSKITMETIT